MHSILYGLLLVLPISGYLIWVHMDADMDVLNGADRPTSADDGGGLLK